MESIVILLGMLYSVLGGFGNHCLDYADVDAYWQNLELKPTEAMLLQMIKTSDKALPDAEKIEELIKNLSAPDFATRTRAAAALTKLGPDALPVLREEIDRADNPETVTTLREILDKLKGQSEGRREHRLMAIRTLGERKTEAAVPFLEKLVESDELFVADFAGRALANIGGEKYTPKPVEVPGFEVDVNLVCSSAAGVVHAKMTSKREDAAAAYNGLLSAIAFIDDGEVDPESVASLKTDVADSILMMIREVGGFRIDSFTGIFPSKFDFEEDQYGLVMVVRGEFDSAKVRTGVLGDGEKKVIDGVEWVGAPEMFLHVASNNLLVLILGSEIEGYVRDASARISGKEKAPATGIGMELARKHSGDAPLFASLGIGEPGTPLSSIASAFVTFKPDGAEGGHLRFSVTGSANRKGQRMVSRAWKGISRLKWASRITDRSYEMPKDAIASAGPIKAEEVGMTVSGDAEIRRHSPLILSLMIYRYFDFF